MRHTATLAGLGIALFIVFLALLTLAYAPFASAHVVDGTYRSDVTAENCGQYDACGSGQSSGGSSDSSSSGSGGTPPDSIAQCESGGSLTVRNSSSAAGKWQILDSTWAGYGGTQYAPTADQATEAEQDSIAAKIWDGGNGAGQWVCKG